MGRIVTIILLGILTGCSSMESINTQTVTQKVPILYCPRPISVERPDLPINNMTDSQKRNIGELAKYYKASVKVLLGYSSELEEIIKQYDTVNTSYDQLRDELDDALQYGTHAQEEVKFRNGFVKGIN